MKGTVRHVHQPGHPGSWTIRYSTGDRALQRCPVCAAEKRRPSRWWVTRRTLDACPRCGGELVDDVARSERVESGFHTEKEADKALARAIVALGDEADVPPDRVTLKDYLLNTWLPMVESTRRPGTAASYRQHVECHIIPYFREVRLQKLTTARINAFYTALRIEPRSGHEGSKPLAISTIRLTHTILHTALKAAVTDGLRVSNPADRATPPRSPEGTNKERPWWNADELKAFLAITADSRLGNLWHLIAMTGMRRGEAIGLRWSEVDMEHGSLRVVRALVPVNGKVIVSQPKTARGRRTIGLDATARVALERQAAQQVNDQVVAGSAYTDNGLVFANEIGGALDPDAVSRAFEEAVSGAPVPHLTLHGLRHSHISIGIAAGESLLVMSRRAGHSREAITADVYGHLAPDLDGAAATRISALVFGDPEQGA